MSEREAFLQRVAREGFVPSDAERFASVWDELEALYIERLEAAIAPFSPWRDRFRAAAIETARLVEEHPLEARFLVVDSLRADAFGRERRLALGARLAALLDRARAELDDDVVVPPATAHWILGIFFDRIYRRCVTGEGPDLPSQVPELMFLAVSTYFGPEEGLKELVRPE